jgi:uncharacterized membrane protein YbhN (UPF0104 family)
MSKTSVQIAVAGFALLLAGFLLSRTLGQYSVSQIREAVAAVPLQRILFAGAFAAASYFCLTIFDALGLRYAGKPLPYWQAALTSFTALSLGHNIGLSALSSGAIRFRFYTRFGLSAEQVAKVILFCAVTVGLGLMMLSGGALVLHAPFAATLLRLPRTSVTAFGLVLLIIALAYVILSTLWRTRTLRLGNWSFELPPPALALSQLFVGTLNFACVAGCLYEALRAVRDVAYPDVVLVYAMANTATILSHAPGGIGVIEWVVLTFLPGSMVVGALVIFRCLYYLLPLFLGTVTLGISELLLRPQARHSRRNSEGAQRVPPFLR